MVICQGGIEVGCNQRVTITLPITTNGWTTIIATRDFRDDYWQSVAADYVDSSHIIISNVRTAENHYYTHWIHYVVISRI